MIEAKDMVRIPVRVTDEDFLQVRKNIREAQVSLDREMAECKQLGNRLLASQGRVERARDRLETLYLELRDCV